MNDKLLMEEMLLLLKSTTEVYVHGTLESSTKEVRDIIKLGLDETLKMQGELYVKMTEYGWYTLQNVDTKMVKQAFNKLTKEN